MSLTDRNKQAIDLYLGRDEKSQGNGTASWRAVYATRTKDAAAAAWSRMLRMMRLGRIWSVGRRY